MNNTNKLIAILGGWIEKDADGVWRSTGFDMKNHHGAPGSRLRVESAAVLFGENSNALVVALGGRGQLSSVPGAPALAEVMKRELMELGVPEGKIIEEKNSGTTYQQLRELLKIAEKISADEITIVSNRYHLPRVRAMVESAPSVKDAAGKYKINFISAEEVLIGENPGKWKGAIESAYADAEMKELMQKEEEGVLQIREGKYKFT